MTGVFGGEGFTASRFAALFAACFFVAAVPVLSVTIPPLVDYPNHLARMHIIAAGEASPFLRDFYEISWRPVPDLAMDLIVPALAKAMPLLWAGKVFLLLSFALLAGGTAALHQALFRRWSAWPCLAFLFLYNRPLLWGFANFVFAVGLALLGAALWIGLRRRSALLRHALAILIALALFLSHLFAFGAYALIILGYEIGCLRERGRLGAGAALRALAAASGQFIIPAVIFLLSAQAGGADGAVVYSRFLRKLDLFFNVLDNYIPWFDIASFLALAALFLLGCWRGAIKLHPAMGPPLLALLAAQLLMPNRLLGAAGVDHRMPLVLALLLIGSSTAVAITGRRARAIVMGLAMLFLARTAIIEAVWLDGEHALKPLVAALMHLPPGSRVAVAYPPSAVHVPRRDPPVLHLAALAVIGADAFVPTLFADPRHQPLRLRAPYARLAGEASPNDFWNVLVAGGTDASGRVGAALAQYDAILFAAGGSSAIAAPPLFALRAEGGGAALFARRQPRR
ncbi:MAG: hypothetical protein JO010_06395 [Alphaproteobacteria bacterium]|nr:hypothetical protein [Alphaproteobacteria bacterium]